MMAINCSIKLFSNDLRAGECDRQHRDAPRLLNDPQRNTPGEAEYLEEYPRHLFVVHVPLHRIQQHGQLAKFHQQR